MSEPRRETPWRRILFKKPTYLAAGVLAFLGILLFDSRLHEFTEGGVDYGRRPALAAATTALMAIWWLSEATSIYITALVPLLLFPLFRIGGGGLLDEGEKALTPYFNAYNFLFLGGMAIAAAMQQWNLHSRIALTILRAIGTRPRLILLGMLMATATISLWISNTATASMMLPIGMALAAQIEKQAGGTRRECFCGSLMLAIAYGANVGGMGTKIGTGPNLIFSSFAARDLGREVTFLEFLAIGFPFVVLFLPVVWLALWAGGRRDAPREDIGRDVIDRQLEGLGPMSRGEWVVLAVFLATAAMWICGQPIQGLLPKAIPLVENWTIKIESRHIEAGIAMLAMVFLLAFPVGKEIPRGPMALNFRSLRLIPWETLILLGGGLALAEGIEASGLSKWMGGHLGVLREAPVFLQYLGVCLVTVYFGAIASNVATTNLMLVVLKSVGIGQTLPLSAAATLSASCDFMLPAGTPPNAIVFGSGYLTIPRMAKVGFVLDFLSASILALWGSTGIRWILG